VQHKALFYIYISFYLFGSSLGHSQYSKVSTADKVMISAHALAAKAGLNVYEQGGNVVDAAVATAYCLGVVEPHGSGIGGEGMMLIYEAKQKKYSIVDFKAISPQEASYQTLDFTNVSEWSRTVRAASVPGAVAGLELAREKFGRLDRQTVLQPAIDYAINGYEVDSTLALNLESYRETLEKDGYAQSIYFPGGEVPKAGDVIKNIDYGNTLREIQKSGADAFYKGKIARLIAEDSKKNGGFITEEDLLAYKPEIKEPLTAKYRSFDIITTPPPCGGMHLIEALKVLEFFDLNRCRSNQDYSSHILAEVFKLIYKDEATFNGDPDFNKIQVSEVTSDEFSFRRFLEINLSRSNHPSQVEPGRIDNKNTTHLCVMDIEGNTVSLTITLSSLFGTGHTVEGAGFMLNNEMQNFNPDENHLNGLKPHKRVVTSLVPTILAKGAQPVYVIGTPGGDLIISTITQIIVNLVDYGMDLSDAVSAPRIFSIFNQRELELENRFPEKSNHLLESLGHDLKYHGDFRAYFGAVQSIMLDTARGKIIGVSDPRRSGAAVGK
jgi:gamma-glutamyltranspeptidase/glutathione hydrolase